VSTGTRTYGGWRERRGFGLAGMSGAQTAGALGVVVLLLGLSLLNPRVLPIVGVPLGLALGLWTVRIRGESAVAWLGRHATWSLARRRRRASYRASGTYRLPGVLATFAMVETSSAGGPVGMTWDQPTNALTTVLPVEPLGLSLVTEEEVSEWVGAWDDWLAHLGYLPDVKHVVVTVHTGPSPPVPPTSRHPSVPSTMAAEVLSELTEPHVSGDADHQALTLVSVTVGVQRNDLEASGQRLLELVSTLSTTLSRCGVRVLEPMSPADLVHWVRSAFDPTQPPTVGATWSDGRPTSTEEFWDHYRHDASVSAAYVWDEAPGARFTPAVLTRLFGPSGYHKRVSLVYEPVAAHDAVREVDRQAEAAAFRAQYRRRLGRDELARDRADLEKARETAADQVRGAGLVDVGLYAVVSASDLTELARCTVDFENRAGESRVRLRRNYGSQAPAFACTLGVGYVPPRGL